VSSLDLTVIALYLLATVGVGFFIARKVHSSEDFFLAGRSLPFWAIGMSLVVSDIGVLEMIGGTQNAYLYGVTQANFEWIGCIPAMVVGALVIIPVYWRSGVYSIPEYLGRRYGAAVQAIQAVVWSVFLGATLGIFFFASGKMFQTAFGWDLWTSVLVTAAVTAVYTVGAGLAAVVYTDVLQCAVMFVGGTVLSFLGLEAVGGVTGLREGLALAGPETASHLELLLPIDMKTTAGGTTDFPWTGILLGLGFVLSPAYWLGNQAIVQRLLGAKDEWSARAALLFGALLKTLVPIAFVLPGLLGVVLFSGRPELDSAAVYPTMILELLPAGLRGVLYAAFLAALMSSVDSYTNSAATVVSRDLYKRFMAPDRQDDHYLKVGRLVSFGMIVLGVAMVPVVEKLTIYEAFQTFLSFFQGPTLTLLLAGLFWRRATEAGGLAALSMGLLCSALLYFGLGVGFLHLSVWSFIVSTLTLVVVSRFTAPPDPERIAPLLFTWRSSGARS
jgi:SSS family solute:Na+ symporter